MDLAAKRPRGTMVKSPLAQNYLCEALSLAPVWNHAHIASTIFVCITGCIEVIVYTSLTKYYTKRAATLFTPSQPHTARLEIYSSKIPVGHLHYERITQRNGCCVCALLAVSVNTLKHLKQKGFGHSRHIGQISSILY